MAKTKKITTEPSGVFFYYKEPPKPKRTKCPGCEVGHVIRKEGKGIVIYSCSKRCGWKCPNGKFHHLASKRISFAAIRATHLKPRKKRSNKGGTMKAASAPKRGARAGA